MKYKVKKDTLWHRADSIVQTDNNGDLIVTIKNADGEHVIKITPSYYPDFFEPISEEDEKVEEAKKLLEKAGAKVTWPSGEMKVADFLNQRIDEMLPFISPPRIPIPNLCPVDCKHFHYDR